VTGGDGSVWAIYVLTLSLGSTNLGEGSVRRATKVAHKKARCPYSVCAGRISTWEGPLQWTPGMREPRVYYFPEPQQISVGLAEMP
jgi:hypothetical protein